MNETEKGTREWLIDIDREGKVVGERPWTVWAKVIVVPKAALTAAEAKWRNLKERESDGRIEQEHRAELAEKERDEWKTQHGYAMEGQKSWKHTAEQNLERAERAEKEREKAQRSRLRHKAHAERSEAALAEARGLEVRFVEAAEWYVRCLNDVIAQVPVRGLAEAEAKYKAAKIAISQFTVKP